MLRSNYLWSVEAKAVKIPVTLTQEVVSFMEAGQTEKIRVRRQP